MSAAPPFLHYVLATSVEDRLDAQDEALSRIEVRLDHIESGLRDLLRAVERLADRGSS